MKIPIHFICLLASVFSCAEEIHHVGTNVSTDPAVRIQAIKHGDQPYRCSIYPEIAKAFEDSNVEQIEIVVSHQMPDAGYMSTTRSYSKSDAKLEMICIEFTAASMGRISVEVRYSNNWRMWFGTKQNLGELCKNRDLPFLF